MLNYPDPFIHPNAYWHLTHDDNRLTERQKRQMLKAVGMDYDREPKKTKTEMKLSVWDQRQESYKAIYLKDTWDYRWQELKVSKMY